MIISMYNQYPMYVHRHILQQMRQEFPTIMADVHYRVLKKKWSNLLQQYKELKNPVHGDKNKSDDVSWPFYGAIDEVLGYGQRVDEDDVNPHEFLCLSVTGEEEPASPEEGQRADSDAEESPSVAALRRIRNLNEDFSIEIERVPPRDPLRRLRPSSKSSRIAQELRRRDASEVLVSRLPPATELSIKTVKIPSAIPALRVKDFSKERDDSPHQFLRDALALAKKNGNHSLNDEDDDIHRRPNKFRRHDEPHKGHECALERRLTEFLDYTKRRDEENRVIMTRILNAVERIAEKH
ncbi:uncharacterized protein LOC105683395 isoform X3 [Athalia rosae]|uniref:uncharacterized protein LOC105683395 isoform X3 n=1 Tax=Athalia rosae TaxID=37344 RepID=UPI002033733F|nr:uncharacterized protein LOC105683395 isoform X3 [Athalia rosae]